MQMHLMIAAASLFTTAPLAIPEPLQPALEIDAFLPALITGLKRNLPDAYSVRDLTVCAPDNVKIKNGQPVSWAVQFALNAKNAGGGYTGLTSYVSTFQKGRAKRVFASGVAGKDGLDGVINRAMMKQIAKCRPIPQATVQALLDTTPAL